MNFVDKDGPLKGTYLSTLAKLKIVRVRSVPNDVSVPFASCPPNWRHSEYYLCQTGKAPEIVKRV